MAKKSWKSCLPRGLERTRVGNCKPRGENVSGRINGSFSG